MNRQIWAIFLVITNVLASFCQITEDFDKPELSQIWEGDRASYTINADGLLQLDALDAGEASLYTSVLLTEEMSWNISFEMDFNPSSNNQLRIYIYRNNPTLESDNALFLEIGQNGSDDGLHLYQRIDGEEDLIASGNMGVFAENPSAELSISITSDNVCAISIISPSFGCIAEDILVPIAPLEIGMKAYFGWTCKFTSTRKNKFSFDDIYVGSYAEDLTSPILESVMYEIGVFTFNFDEPVLSDIVISIDPSLVITTSSQKRSLTISGDFQENQGYMFTLQNTSDLAGNLLDTSITYLISRSPQIGDILINEILFNPRGSGADYVEIINASEEMLSLRDVMIANLDKDQFFPISKSQIESGSLLVLTSNKDNVINNYPSHNATSIVQQSIPTWNNDDDNVAIVLNNEVIDEFDYDENMHLSFLDLEDGVSLERISTIGNTADLDNWTSASATSGYGTPGLPNSTSSQIGSANQIKLFSKIISPNADGDRDELEVTYILDSPGYVASASIYSDSGNLITHVFRNQSLSISGTFSWNAKNNNGISTSTGLYILHIELFNLSGSQFQKKLSFGIADYIP
ncbi:MAG: hypothetical protein ACI9FN_001084 [Saprospiraceae bacterium]|jgi:hypothetical protein